MRAVSNRLSAYTQRGTVRALLGEHRDLYGLLEELEPRPRRRLLGSCDYDVYGEDAQMMEGMNMPAVLEGKVALVTGVSYDKQIGQAVAKVPSQFVLELILARSPA